MERMDCGECSYETDDPAAFDSHLVIVHEWPHETARAHVRRALGLDPVGVGFSQ